MCVCLCGGGLFSWVNRGKEMDPRRDALKERGNHKLHLMKQEKGTRRRVFVNVGSHEG